jgi:hypothetical protein
VVVVLMDGVERVNLGGFPALLLLEEAMVALQQTILRMAG